MVSVGMVFSAGGAKGDPFHSGVIAAIAEHTGFNSRDAELVVGTSAGSFTATALRAGLSPIDAEARHLGRGLSAEAPPSSSGSSRPMPNPRWSAAGCRQHLA